MNTDSFMWFLTILGVAAFVVYLLKRVFTPREDFEEEAAEIECSRREELGGLDDTPEPAEPRPRARRPYFDYSYMSDAVRLFRSLTVHWKLFTAGVIVLAISRFVPILIYQENDIGRALDLISRPPFEAYAEYITRTLSGTLTGLTMVYRAALTVATYPLSLFVAFDLYLLTDHPDAAVRTPAKTYYKLILLGVVPWAMSFLNNPLEMQGMLSILFLAGSQSVLGLVASTLAIGYFFGYVQAYLRGSDDPHNFALLTAFNRFKPLYVFYLILLLFPYLATGLASVITTIQSMTGPALQGGYISWLNNLTVLIAAALFVVPPFIVIGGAGVRRAVTGALRTIRDNPAGYALFLLAVALVYLIYTITMGTVFGYAILPYLDIPVVYFVTNYLLGAFIKLAVSVFCLCMLAAFFMRNVPRLAPARARVQLVVDTKDEDAVELPQAEQ